jgi:uncharacterized membrane protein
LPCLAEVKECSVAWLLREGPGILSGFAAGSLSIFGAAIAALPALFLVAVFGAVLIEVDKTAYLVVDKTAYLVWWVATYFMWWVFAPNIPEMASVRLAMAAAAAGIFAGVALLPAVAHAVLGPNPVMTLLTL